MSPRPSKSINPGSDGGSLDAPSSRPRAHVWTKYSEAGGGQPSELEVTIDDLTFVDDAEAGSATEPDTAGFSKYAQRSMPGHAKVVAAAEATPEGAIDEVPKRLVKDWVSTTTVEGRIYRRTDAATMVEAEAVTEEETTSWVQI